MKTLQLKTVTALCLLMLFTGFTTQAQEKKPTKEETIEFIESYFKSNAVVYFDDGYDLDGGGHYFRQIDIKDVAVRDCILEYSYIIESRMMTTVHLYDPKITHYTNSINLNNVESISIVRGIKKKDNGITYKLRFNEKKQAKKEEILLPFAYSAAGFDAQEDSQIYKAFQHLRKLCGAPEPLKF